MAGKTRAVCQAAAILQHNASAESYQLFSRQLPTFSVVHPQNPISSPAGWWDFKASHLHLLVSSTAARPGALRRRRRSAGRRPLVGQRAARLEAVVLLAPRAHLERHRLPNAPLRCHTPLQRFYSCCVASIDTFVVVASKTTCRTQEPKPREVSARVLGRRCTCLQSLAQHCRSMVLAASGTLACE